NDGNKPNDVHIHAFENATVVKEATCTQDGKQTATCNCGFLEVTVLPATGNHTYQNKVCTVCKRNDPTGLTSPVLSGDALSSYVIVYDKNASDYTVRAAEYIAQEILARTNITLPVLPIEESTEVNAHEIVVGETFRQISQNLNAQTQGLEFAFLADENQIAIEGDYFIIAAAAYYFVETYIPEAIFDIDVPQTISVCTPIVKEAENFIFLIGDGMGPNQTKLFDAYKDESLADYSDGEDFFYGNLFPYIGEAKTNSLSGTTDSAASGTALASGYKTKNGAVGRDGNNKDVPSLTELAAQKGMATAVMSTEKQTGATPASFSAHAYDRSNAANIQKSQAVLVEKHGTIINCDYNVYTESEMTTLRNAITETLATLSKDEDGFFVMYEEAYIDKHCHNEDAKNAYLAMVRFNQAIALFMEYAFYNPETMIIITADHETGGLQIDENGEFKYTSDGDHTSTNVPVFAYGANTEVFGGKTIENVQIPKTLAKMMGGALAAQTDATYPPLL
ncbi:MAG: alkaline phosphatase, partial [Clostridia bacterium]|nr:alkaline phosphatase [Clostridia bacterium]